MCAPSTYYKNMGFREGDFSEAEKHEQDVIVPVYPGLSLEEQKRVVRRLVEGYNL